jgi:hypothetical protein
MLIEPRSLPTESVAALVDPPGDAVEHLACPLGPCCGRALATITTSAPESRAFSASRHVWTSVVSASDAYTRSRRIATHRSGNAAERS